MKLLVLSHNTADLARHGVRGADLCAVENTPVALTPPKLDYQEPLLTESLTNNTNSQLTHTSCSMCITDLSLRIKQPGEKTELRKSQGRGSIFTVFIFLNGGGGAGRRSGPTQFKPVLSKGRLVLP